VSVRRKRNRFATATLPTRWGAAKAGPQSFGGPMSGIYMILVFLAVMAALNRFEFGRFD